METTERIVEAYVRYIKGWATIPNIRCKGQFEIDLLAIDPASGNRYHIESSVGVSSYSKLSPKPFSAEDLKVPVKKAMERRKIGFFIERKFGHSNVTETLKTYGFRKDKYSKIIVSWGWYDEAEKIARKHHITLWDFREMINEITSTLKDKHGYFMDDTMRTLHLFARADQKMHQQDKKGI